MDSRRLDRAKEAKVRRVKEKRAAVFKMNRSQERGKETKRESLGIVNVRGRMRMFYPRLAMAQWRGRPLVLTLSACGRRWIGSEQGLMLGDANQEPAGACTLEQATCRVRRGALREGASGEMEGVDRR